MEPKFFAEWRKWLEQHHNKERELLVGFYRKDSGKPSITWPESVDAALCFGWIDGVRHRLDETSYSIRFTPRNPQHLECGEHQTSTGTHGGRAHASCRPEGIRGTRREAVSHLRIRAASG